MYRRRPTRFLAPLALFAAFAAVFAIVTSDSDTGSSDPAATTARTSSSGTATSPRTSASTPTTRRTYTVKPGDVLSGIAARTGVPLERILLLNPDLDPQALQAGQKLKLRR